MLHLLIPLIFSGSLFLLFAVFSRVGVYVCNGAALSAFSLLFALQSTTKKNVSFEKT